MTPQQHLDHLNHMAQQLQPWTNDFQHIVDIINLAKPFAEKIARFSEDQQQLNIAIMGQVKAGKSSFLNALLFNGKPVLPEASTPKTANLTRISWGEKPTLDIEYYSLKDWGDIEATALSTGDHAEAKSARELVQMVKTANIDAKSIISKGKESISAENLDGLMGLLNNYAGNNGQYTALVKMTRLYLPLDELKGFDIVDTPGMNDPVISRTQRTKEEMTRSDVVFFLSRCGQFLDASDMELLSRQLPSKGVKRLVLVAGQYDSAILDDGYDRDSLAATEANLTKRLGQRAQQEMSALADQREKSGSTHTAQLLRTLTQPIFASTYAHTFASLPPDQWSSKNMAHVHQELTEMAADQWDDYVWTNEDWTRIGNFTQLTAAYQTARLDKIAILKQQLDGLVPDSQQQLKEMIETLKDSASMRIHQLESQDLDSLNKTQAEYESRIQRIVEKLQISLGEVIAQAATVRQSVLSRLKQDLQQYKNISTLTGTETQTSSREVDDSTWYKPWTWGDTRTVTRTHTVSYDYLSASDAVEQVADYANECADTIRYQFEQLVNAKAIKAAMRRELLDALDTKNQNFDPQQLRQLLDQALAHLSIPDLDLDVSDAAQQIEHHFTGQVRGADMDALKQQLNEALQQVLALLSQRFERGVQLVTAALSEIQQNLQQQLTAQVQQELDKVRQGLAEKERSIAHCQQLLTVLG